MPVTTARRSKVIGLVALLTLLLWLSWWTSRPDERATERANTAAGDASQPSDRYLDAMDRSVSASVRLPPSPTVVASPGQMPAATRPQSEPSSSVEICDVGTVSSQELDVVLDWHVVSISPRWSSAAATLIAGLRQHGSPMSRAVSEWAEIERDLALAAQAAGIPLKACTSDAPACLLHAPVWQRLQQQRLTRHRESAAELARQTGDPAVHAYATARCWLDLEGRLASRCLPTAINAWQRVEPDNAAPWLADIGMHEAAAGAQETADRLFRASQARRCSQYGHSPWQALDTPAARQAPGPVRAGLISLLTSNPMMAVGIALKPVSEYCTQQRVVNANVAQTCEGLISLMLDKADDLVGLYVGQRLAQRLNWPRDRWALADDVRAVQTEVSLNDSMGLLDVSCKGLERSRSVFSAYGRLGEREQVIRRARAHFQAQGLTLQQAAQAERERRAAEVAAKAASSAAAGTAPDKASAPR